MQPDRRPTGSVLALLCAFAFVLSGCLQPAPETRAIVAHSTMQGRSSAHVELLGVVDGQHGAAGLVIPVEVTVARGHGSVVVDAPFEVAKDTKASILDGVRAATFVAGLRADAFDFEVRFGPSAGSLSGPSGGSQFALAFYVALNNLLDPERPLHIRDEYAGTGTVSRHGGIGPVGGIPAKLQAAADVAEVFAYPKGPVRASLFAHAVDMPQACAGVGLHCAPVGSLADLIEVAAAPGPGPVPNDSFASP